MSDAAVRAASAKLLRKHLCDGVRVQDLVSMLADCEYRTLSNGAAICQEGEKGDTLFILLEGRVRVLKRDPRGEERELTTLKPPALLGHMSLIDGSTRSATCLSVGESRVVIMSRRVYDFRINEIGPPGTALRRLLLSSLTHQLVRGNAQLSDLLTDDFPEDDATAEEDQQALLRTAGALRGWSLDDDLEDMLSEVEVVQTEDDKRTRGERRNS